MRILRANERHFNEIMAIERASFSTPWSEESVRYVMADSDVRVMVIEEEGSVLGFAILHRSLDEGELYNIAVRADRRGEGLGGRLLDTVLYCAKRWGIRRVFLEVRRSNAAARGLYKSRGFAVCGERKNYYDAPKEDAILMDAVITEETA